MRACVRACVRACACVRASVRACERVRVAMCGKREVNVSYLSECQRKYLRCMFEYDSSNRFVDKQCKCVTTYRTHFKKLDVPGFVESMHQHVYLVGGDCRTHIYMFVLSLREAL